MIRTATYFLYNIRKSRNKLTFAMTKCLIHSLVFSRLIYCCSLLCNLPVNLMYKIERIKRRSIRILYKLNFASIVSISDLMRSLGWLKFRYICIHRLLGITHKAIHRGFPEYIAQSITIQSSNRSSRKCHIMKLVQQSTSLAFSSRLLLRKAGILFLTIFVVFHQFHCLNVNCMFILSHCNSFYFILLFVLYLFLFLFFIYRRL